MDLLKISSIVLLALGFVGGTYDFLQNGNHVSLFVGVTCFVGILFVPR